MIIDDLNYVFSEQIALGAQSTFVYAIEHNGDSLPKVEKHNGSLAELLPYLDTLCFSRFMQTNPKMPVFTDFKNVFKEDNA